MAMVVVEEYGGGQWARRSRGFLRDLPVRVKPVAQTVLLVLPGQW